MISWPLFFKAAPLFGAVAATIGYVVWLRTANAELNADLSAAVTERDGLLEAVYIQKTALRRLQEQLEADAERAQAALEARQEVNRAPDSDDGAVAPVLGRVLSRLRGAD